MLGSRRSSLVCCTVDTGCRRRLLRVLKVVSIVATEEVIFRVRPNGGPSQQSRALEEGSRGIRTFYVRGWWWWIKSTDTRVVQDSGAVQYSGAGVRIVDSVSFLVFFVVSVVTVVSLLAIVFWLLWLWYILYHSVVVVVFDLLIFLVVVPGYSKSPDHPR